MYYGTEQRRNPPLPRVGGGGLGVRGNQYENLIGDRCGNVMISPLIMSRLQIIWATARSILSSPSSPICDSVSGSVSLSL